MVGDKRLVIQKIVNYLQKYATPVNMSASLQSAPDEIELKVYFDEDYHFISRTSTKVTIHEYLKQLEKEFYLLFNEPTTLCGLQTITHTDIPQTQPVHRMLLNGESVYPLRSIVSTTPGKLLVQILKLPAFDAETQ